MSYEPTKWWKVVDSDGNLWCETSSEKEAKDNMRPGDFLYRLYEKVEREWRIES